MERKSAHLHKAHTGTTCLPSGGEQEMECGGRRAHDNSPLSAGINPSIPFPTAAAAAAGRSMS